MQLTPSERELRNQLLELTGHTAAMSGELTKRQIREVHLAKRVAVMAAMNGSYDYQLRCLRENLAAPREIDLTQASPVLTRVETNTPEADLFSAASLLWSVPVSRGFGRRMRYLVKDAFNGKLIGLIGLTDPVFNLAPRDRWVGWTSADRKKRLVNVMDAFVLGAVPPYAQLLGGKLVALLATSCEVVADFRTKYRTYSGVISKTGKDPRLVLLTTSSALGRSSLYNRLRIPGSVAYLTNVAPDRVSNWYTQGYGHFHISQEMFARLQDTLTRRGHPYAKGNKFGNGPNWRLRVIRQAAIELGIRAEVLQHGIHRQVYVAPLASNAQEYLLGKAKRPEYLVKSSSEISAFWRERWAKPRADRFPRWRQWNAGGMIAHLNRIHSRAAEEGL